MLNKYGSLGAAWVASDAFTLLQLGWLKAKLPEVYEWTMDLVSPISLGIHTAVVATWSVAKEFVVSLAASSS